ncbi:MAG: hypothetical protein NTW86_22230, partial [Candidatus Sumerlaeota bacterium]|nr:hypothetical protein [Candidatus Sumerlaeota bacterium]
MASSPESLSRERALVRQRDIWAMIVPLALVTLLMGASQNVVNALLARVQTATDELAGFGIGYWLVMLLWSPCMHLDQMVLALGRHRRSFRGVFRFGVGLGLALFVVALAVAGIPGLRRLVFITLQRSPDEATASRAAFIVFALALVPLIEAIASMARGALIRARKTHYVFAIVMCAQVLSILGALSLARVDIIQRRPLLLPVIAFYIFGLTRALLFLAVTIRVVWPRLPEDEAPPLAFGPLLRFQYPLFITNIMMAISRPVINAFIGSLADAKTGLAALAIAFPLSNLTYGWLNEIRVLHPAFHGETGSRSAIRRFAAYSSTAVFVLTLVLYGTPVSEFLLRRIMGVEESLVAPCRQALLVFCFFPFVVAARGYMQGVSVAQRQTRTMAWSGPIRVASILFTLVALAQLGVAGATLGAVALFVGFVA